MGIYISFVGALMPLASALGGVWSSVISLVLLSQQGIEGGACTQLEGLLCQPGKNFQEGSLEYMRGSVGEDKFPVVKGG